MTDLPPPAVPPQHSPATSGGFASHALMAVLIGLIFLYFGWPAVAGLLHRSDNPYGAIWPPEHPQAGQRVPFLQVQAGTAWRDIGALATGVVLLGEAAAYGLMSLQPGRQRTLAGVIIGLGVAGCAANVLSAVMQYQAGYRDLPLYAAIGLILCVLSITQAKPLRA